METPLVIIQQYTGIARDVTSILSAIALTVIAHAGLRTWRSQLKGKTEYELARRVLHRVYGIREAVREVRKPYIGASEKKAAFKESGFDNPPPVPGHSPASLRAVYRRRWRLLDKRVIELDVDVLEAEAIWGTPLREALLHFRQNISMLQYALERYLQWKEDADNYPLGDQEGSRIEDTIHDIYYLTDVASTNEFTGRFARSIAEIEQFLRPRMSL
jgi:hypothetical protein